MSGPDGAWGCSLAEHEEAVRPRWRASVSGAYTATELSLGGDARVNETRGVVLASLAYAPSPAIAVQAALGAVVGGNLEWNGSRYLVQPGPTGLLGFLWRILDGKPFLSLSATLSFMATETEPSGGGGQVGYEAFDARAGVTFGTILFDILSPYAIARAFGGPVYWRYQGSAVTGTDIHHYQLGAGLAVHVARHVDAYVEGVPLGEQTLAGGMAFAF